MSGTAAGTVRALASARIGTQESNEFIRGPKWRTQTTRTRRSIAAMVTFALIVAVGAAILSAVIWSLDRLGAPSWLGAVPWIVPTIGAVTWALARPTPAVATDDDDDGWSTYSIQFIVIGEDEPRNAPTRVAAATLFGAPVVWSLVVFGLSTLVGLF